jgi:hypothetical protein
VRCEAGPGEWPGVQTVSDAEQPNAALDRAEEQKELWWKALKLPIFTVSLIPLLVRHQARSGQWIVHITAVVRGSSSRGAPVRTD